MTMRQSSSSPRGTFDWRFRVAAAVAAPGESVRTFGHGADAALGC